MIHCQLSVVLFEESINGADLFMDRTHRNALGSSIKSNYSAEFSVILIAKSATGYPT